MASSKGESDELSQKSGGDSPAAGGALPLVPLDEEANPPMASVKPGKPFAMQVRNGKARLELVRRVAERGGIRHVFAGTLKLSLPGPR